MAAGGSIGALVVRLGLDAAEYVQGLNRAEYQAQKFAQNTRRAIAEVAKVLGGLEVARQVYENTKAIIEQAASLNDLADATGSTVENLSRLSNQAKIAGTDFQTLQGLVLKLSAGMAGADDETSKVGMICCSDVGTIATELHGHFHARCPCPDLRVSMRPLRTYTKYSLGLAVMKPQRFSFSGSSTGLPARQPC